MHSNEQDLRCPGCHKRFTRLGALIGHIELETCKSLPNIDIDLARREKEQSNAAVQSARSFNDFSRTGVSFSEEPHPLVRTPGFPSPAQRGQAQAQAIVAPPRQPPPNIMDAQEPLSTPGNAWTGQQSLFPDAPPAVAPPPDLAATMLQTNAQPGPEANPYDPDTPGFDSRKYYITIINKFKCPYRGCGKSINNRNAFIAHLKSPAHRNEKLQCSTCLRYYDTATALTQHMESQGVRCKVRESNSYMTAVDQVTGGVALPFGKHQDNTVKYVVNSGVFDPASGGVVAASKSAAEVKNQTFNKFWEDHVPKW
ncbi:uncharacterized protein LY89DRAFT_656880 [Mollisia scopiformis]|uniref:C2H2-type domain-containing protein n=1 Tax=Mollisia scopiformis TaxID=149040 RepID=A0A132BCQ9_MOLSC|nr:uncharacterized protein LY89DRAFT_656880 [Mollisia scopiformis]KUJ10205.1 hypothetical protein LY89DRAFT_656880 [Mollisia scopiformis]